MLKVKQLGRRLVSVIGAAAISLSLLSGINLTKPAEVKAATVSDLSANQITTNMGLGWNLGNSLESTGRGSSSNITDFETYWGNPVVTESLIKAVKAKGFSTIRIPVSWYEHVSYDNGNYTIDSKWLARVKQVVDYAYVFLTLRKTVTVN
ncbi:MAG: cellulase family glycosylhydrolase [Lachnospiraceae bacterium]|nr:cellulase family glycosylhydrolase [Lachnospiraceae bacterium]